MRGVDLLAKARAVGRALGVEVEHLAGVMPCFRVFDPTLDKAEGTIRAFEVHYRLASQAERALKQLHSDVYRARGEEVWRRQEKKCCFCGKEIRDFEIDHIKSRGAHGRDDSLANLRCCCTGIGACDGHRRRHGG